MSKYPPLFRSIHIFLFRCWSNMGKIFAQKKLRAMQVSIDQGVSGVKHVGFEGNNAVGRYTQFSGRVDIGYGTTLGACSTFSGPITIGRYCQLGANVGVFGKDHPTSYFSININYRFLGGALNNMVVVDEVKIGNDVWVGHGAVILKGCQIGNGAVIGAGAVVTRSIPEYAIVVGNPARVLRYRFDEDTIRLLEQLRWWDLSKEELAEEKDRFLVDLVAQPALGKENLEALIHKYRG